MQEGVAVIARAKEVVEMGMAVVEMGMIVMMDN